MGMTVNPPLSDRPVLGIAIENTPMAHRLAT